VSITIGSIAIEEPVFLAPMSGITDQPTRKLVRRCGAGLVFSEMIASAAVVRQERDSLKESRKVSSNCAEEFPMAIQLAGHEPEVMAEAARLSVERGAAIIDLNFGCPAKKVTNKYSGSALMREEGLAVGIIDAVVRAAGGIPVTLKMRTGWDDQHRNAPRLARLARDCGVQLVTVHGRTRTQMYRGASDWRFIGDVKAAVPDLPVVLNGDILTVDDAKEALSVSGADGVMIGRGAYGKPWFLKQTARFLRTGERMTDPAPHDRLDMIMTHYESLLSHYGIRAGVRIARKHLCHYAKGLRNSAKFRAEANREEDPEKVMAVICEHFSFASPEGVRGVAA